jgi:hypothetical protein
MIGNGPWFWFTVCVVARALGGRIVIEGKETPDGDSYASL